MGDARATIDTQPSANLQVSWVLRRAADRYDRLDGAVSVLVWGRLGWGFSGRCPYSVLIGCFQDFPASSMCTMVPPRMNPRAGTIFEWIPYLRARCPRFAIVRCRRRAPRPIEIEGLFLQHRPHHKSASETSPTIAPHRRGAFEFLVLKGPVGSYLSTSPDPPFLG